MRKFFVQIKDKVGGNWMFLGFVMLGFLIIFIVDIETFRIILLDFVDMFVEILPVLLLVYVIIFGFNLIISNKRIVSFLKKGSYKKKLFLSVLLGIVSSGPIYLWYGLLKQINDAGLTLGHIASFSYARAIKFPLLPIMITYFGLKFSVLFFVVLFVFSFLQAVFVDFLKNRF